jgi:hypothetical protein
VWNSSVSVSRQACSIRSWSWSKSGLGWKGLKVNFLMVALGFLSVVSGFHLMGADSWEPIRVASGASNLPMEHFARSELEREFWEPSEKMGVSEPIIWASGASSLPMEHFARSELERDDWEPGVGASLPIRTASGASSLPIEHFARSELERDV